MRRLLIALLLASGCSSHFHRLLVTSNPSGQEIEFRAYDEDGKLLRPVGNECSPTITPYEFTVEGKAAYATVLAGKQLELSAKGVEKRQFDPLEGVFGIKHDIKELEMGFLYPIGGLNQPLSIIRIQEVRKQLDRMGFVDTKIETKIHWQQAKSISFHHGLSEMKISRDPIIGLPLWREETWPQDSTKTMHFDIALVTSQLK